MLGKIWNAPNSVLGVAIGILGTGVGVVAGTSPSIGIGNNAIEFSNHPFIAEGRALTVGNVSIHAGTPGDILDVPAGTTFGLHERQHTFQGEFLGPAYLPANISTSAYSWLTVGNQADNNPFESGPYGSPPNGNPPTPWGCGD